MILQHVEFFCLVNDFSTTVIQNCHPDLKGIVLEKWINKLMELLDSRHTVSEIKISSKCMAVFHTQQQYVCNVTL